MKEVARRLARVSSQIDEFALRHGRTAGSVNLLAVSKTKPVEAVLAAVEAGQRHFGENHLQDALTKVRSPALAGLGLCWHFVGPVQSNKTRPIATHFDWVHSVDRVKIARRLSEQRPPGRAPLNLCIQVNIDGESTKSGAPAAAVAALARELQTLPGVRLRGLMAIPRPHPDLAAQRQPFARLHQLLQALNAELGTRLDTLSMGMSGDLEAAIAEGATWVRVGTAIFGTREPVQPGASTP